MAQSIPLTSAVTLEWNGSDVDNDIVVYDVYFGTENPPSLNTNDITDSQIILPVSSNTINYWNIINRDSEGNTSESGVFQFRVM